MIDKVECFKAEESPVNPGFWVINPVHENFHLKNTSGSYNVICARLLNLSYPQYLRFCRDLCGATIVGKNTMYPIAYFKHDDRLNALTRLLNTRANVILWNEKHPDWEQHLEELKAKGKLTIQEEEIARGKACL